MPLVALTMIASCRMPGSSGAVTPRATWLGAADRTIGASSTASNGSAQATSRGSSARPARKSSFCGGVMLSTTSPS